MYLQLLDLIPVHSFKLTAKTATNCLDDLADSFVWFGRSNIYKNKEKTELLSKVSLYCWTVSTVVSAIIEVSPLASDRCVP